MLNHEESQSIILDQEILMNFSVTQVLLTQEMEVLSAQSDRALAAADQVSIAHKILDLAGKIRSLEENEIIR